MTDKKDHIKRFKDIYERKHNVVISDELALEYFESLVLLVSTIYKPIKK